jgi:hypothetical protein
MFDQLKQMNNILVEAAALGAVDRRDPAPHDKSDAGRPFKDWLPQVKPCSGPVRRIVHCDSGEAAAFLAHNAIRCGRGESKNDSQRQ